ncbi:DEAD/DEAH box helicase [bacterium]|nr:DEAD/DEAH box helicase [bacterium]
MKFTELNLPDNILESIEAMGFKELTPIQEATYPIISSGQDLCALAETGSGKTTACAIPLIQKIDPSVNEIQGLVIVPTRELCIQYVNEIHEIAKKTEVVSFAVFGGIDKSVQIAKIKHQAHILVATPGRLIDLMMDGVIELKNVKCAILDEADELLAASFFDEVKFVMSCILHEHQTLLFSATMDEEIKKLAHDCLKNPKYISLIKDRMSPTTIKHDFIFLSQRMKEKELLKILKNYDIKQGIIFCNARHGVDSLLNVLKREVKDVDCLHAGFLQDKRYMIISNFKKGKTRFLIATDVAGRGLDFSKVTHVINWDFPGGAEQYTHRTGRVGRMGREGHAITFVTKRDLPGLRSVLKAKKIIPNWIGEDPFRQ